MVHPSPESGMDGPSKPGWPVTGAWSGPELAAHPLEGLPGARRRGCGEPGLAPRLHEPLLLAAEPLLHERDGVADLALGGCRGVSGPLSLFRRLLGPGDDLAALDPLALGLGSGR